jgi:hypothetical protein
MKKPEKSYSFIFKRYRTRQKLYDKLIKRLDFSVTHSYLRTVLALEGSYTRTIGIFYVIIESMFVSKNLEY